MYSIKLKCMLMWHKCYAKAIEVQ